MFFLMEFFLMLVITYGVNLVFRKVNLSKIILNQDPKITNFLRIILSISFGFLISNFLFTSVEFIRQFVESV